MIIFWNFTNCAETDFIFFERHVIIIKTLYSAVSFGYTFCTNVRRSEMMMPRRISYGKAMMQNSFGRIVKKEVNYVFSTILRIQTYITCIYRKNDSSRRKVFVIYYVERSSYLSCYRNKLISWYPQETYRHRTSIEMTGSSCYWIRIVIENMIYKLSANATCWWKDDSRYVEIVNLMTERVEMGCRTDHYDIHWLLHIFQMSWTLLMYWYSTFRSRPFWKYRRTSTLRVQEHLADSTQWLSPFNEYE